MLIKDIVSNKHKSINPHNHKSTLFSHYSLPAFDAGKKAVCEYGESIMSNKFILHQKAILFNKLNIKFKRIWNVKHPLENSICSSEFIPLVVDESVCLQDYLYYFLCSEPLTNNLLGCVSGTSNSQQRIRPEDLLKQEIILPSIIEQRHIVDILGSIDTSIENNERIILKLEEKLLLEYDNIIVNNTLLESEMQDIFDISIGKTPPRKESYWFTENQSDIKWLSIADMGKAQVFAFDSNEKIVREGIEKYNVKIVPENTVLLSFKLTVGKVIITGCEMATNEAIAHFVTKDPEITEYLYCYFKRYNFDLLGNTSSIATAVNSKTIKAMKFSYPERTVIKDFHTIAEPLMKKIKHLLITNAKLNELKQLYLKKFFG